MFLFKLLALAWLASIVGCIAFALLQLSRIAFGSKPASPAMAVWPFVGVGLLTLPLWLEAALLEVQCRRAGLTIREPTAATRDGLFWRSHVVDPNGYSNGIRFGSDALRQAFTLNAIRAVAEGRIAYLEVPYEPAGDPARTLNQKLYVAARSVAGSQCLYEPLASMHGSLPGAYCVAWQTVENMGTRYELVGNVGEQQVGTTLAVKDRVTGRSLGAYSYVKATRASETLLALFGIRSMQPLSCKEMMTDMRPAAMLLALVFGSPDGSKPSPNQLADYEKSPWVVVDNSATEVVPEGKAGIEYWVTQGKVRPLTLGDMDLWLAALAPETLQLTGRVPDNAYLIEGPITLPANLYGGNAVIWILGRGQRIPPGPRSHSSFLEVCKGCVWGPAHCK